MQAHGFLRTAKQDPRSTDSYEVLSGSLEGVRSAHAKSEWVSEYLMTEFRCVVTREVVQRARKCGAREGSKSTREVVGLYQR
jgi:hypothetical protein